jgi:hypothetical protein
MGITLFGAASFESATNRTQEQTKEKALRGGKRMTDALARSRSPSWLLDAATDADCPLRSKRPELLSVVTLSIQVAVVAA